MSERDEQHESEFECEGCGQYFNGYGTLSHHTERCQKFLLLNGDDRDPPDDYHGE